MEGSKIQTLFKQFLSEFNSAREAEVWENQKQIFKRFWSDKILNPASELIIPGDTDGIIRLLDVKGRGRQRTDTAVANVGLRQGMWERLFDHLKNKREIQRTLDQSFAEDDDAKLIDLLDRLERENKNNKNGLTGKSAVALNALLFINHPTKFLSMVSLAHRFQVMRAFSLGSPDEFRTYGAQIVLSNRSIIEGFRDKYGIEANPRDLSEFLYTPHSGYTTNVRVYWQEFDRVPPEAVDDEPADIPQDADEAEFVIEKHLEDFLVRNWERTELGKKYDLIEENGKFSQQYPTPIGRIDLLVRSKKTKQYVVIELKKGQPSDDTVGQVARYMGWVKSNLAGGHEVKGIIIAGDNDTRLHYALQVMPDVELFVYKVDFTLKKIASL